MILRDNGYHCDEGLVFYFKTRQRVRIVFDEAPMAQTLRTIAEVHELAARRQIPEPLVDSPKCPG